MSNQWDCARALLPAALAFLFTPHILTHDGVTDRINDALFYSSCPSKTWQFDSERHAQRQIPETEKEFSHRWRYHSHLFAVFGEKVMWILPFWYLTLKNIFINVLELIVLQALNTVCHKHGTFCFFWSGHKLYIANVFQMICCCRLSH